MFALGKLHKAGSIIDIEEKDAVYYKDGIEKVATTKPTKEKAVSK